MSFKPSFFALLCLPFTWVMADDTELFVSDVSSQYGIKPQVLIIFDNSGSMKSSEQIVAEPYDSSVNYIPDDKSSRSNRIYWSSNAGEIPSSDSSNYFLTTDNNCQASLSSLSANGLYNGNVRHWVENKNQAKKSSWKKLNSGNGTWVDCKEDLQNSDPSNPASPSNPGYTKDGKNGPYTTSENSEFSGDDAVTLYSANYIYWNETSGNTSKSRLLIAKEAIEQLIRATPSVDFGLAIFNQNGGDGSSDKNGGRIVNKIQSRDDNSKQELINMINNLNAETWTPLCETMYEAYRYFGGHGVYYGNDNDSATPARDTTAELSGEYISPFVSCQERAYIILMTDGEPTNDGHANSTIATLTGEGPIEGSYMPTLTQWMNTNDIDGNSANGNQYISTYTIGFGQTAVDDAGALLSKTAELGGGEYYPAASADSLQQAFQATIFNILSSSSSLSSPAIANNNFDRTRSLDYVYYSMFLPSHKSIWEGNIKKLVMNNQGILVDRNGDPAIDDEGNIIDTASTYWGGVEDGNTVTEGGVAAMLNAVSSRKVLSNIDATSLKEPNATNLKTYYGLSDDSALATQLEVEEGDLPESLSWLVGIDVDDENGDGSTTDYRSDIFADPLHSKPLAITYTEGSNQVVRLLVGTNAGFLHMFTDHGDTVSENWAFIPEELLNSGLGLRFDSGSSEHHYGMDLSPIAIKTYTSGELDKIIAIVGMRRGGTSYFALDITDADNPSLLWKIDSATTGFNELAQTWSIPSAGMFSYKDGSVEKTAPGIVFGAGYDTNKDNCTPSDSETCEDDTGRGVYVVNALTGDLIWSVEGGSCADGDKHCLTDSIPSQVSLLDSDSDNYIDRIYVGDTAANMWRMDLVGTDTSKWSHIKLAQLGGDTEVTNRKIFTAPVVVQTYEFNVSVGEDSQYIYKKIPYDGVLFGTGDRSRPASDTTTQDNFYALHDYTISPTLYGETGYPSKPDPMTDSDFYDITSDPAAGLSDEQLITFYTQLTSLSGWKYQFADDGEKSLGKGTVINGTVYFTSFVPNSVVNITCGVSDLGIGWLYGVDLHTGSPSFQAEDGTAMIRRDIGSRVPDSLVIHSGEDTEGNSAIRLLGVGQGDTTIIVDEVTQEEETVYTGTVDTDTDMMPRRIYSFFEEK